MVPSSIINRIDEVVAVIQALEYFIMRLVMELSDRKTKARPLDSDKNLPDENVP